MAGNVVVAPISAGFHRNCYETQLKQVYTVSEIPQGYHDIPEEDRKKAKLFFDRGTTVAGTGNYEFAIEMYLQGLAIDPDSKDIHQLLRDISLKRKASGGKDLGMFEKMKLRRAGKTDLESMLRAERLLAYDPGNTDNMLSLMRSAHKAGFYDTVIWIGPLLLRANMDTKSPDISKYLALRDIYVELKLWKQATDACQKAYELRPDDMDLQRVVKDLGAVETMSGGGYMEGKSFRDSVRDMDKQKKLFDSDKDVRSVDLMASQVIEAQAEYDADLNEPGKLMKLVDALVKTELMANENRAIELLSEWYEKTKSFRFRLMLGKIKINQLRRQDRAERARLAKNPGDEQIKKEYLQFAREKTEEELKEFSLYSENYPTDMTFRYEIGVRMFLLEQYHDCISVFQSARNDPKCRTDASTYLGRAFLFSGYVDEAVDTLKGVIDEYEVRGDGRSKELFYWYGRAQEQKGDMAATMKTYSQLVQWDFNYRDVQARIKRLRGGQQAAPSQEAAK